MEAAEDYNPENDLFLTPELIPADVQAVLDRHTMDSTDLEYWQLENMLKDVQQLGYTFDYYLDAIPFDLHKI